MLLQHPGIVKGRAARHRPGDKRPRPCRRIYG